MKTLVVIAHALLSRVPFCSLAGMLVGSITGTLFGLTLFAHPGASLDLKTLLGIGLLLGLLGFVFVLFFIGVLLRYGIGQIFLPGLVNALITAVITVLVDYVLQVPELAGWVGLLIGLLVGAILCRLCEAWSVAR